MRVAFLGKGGAGKSIIAGTCARILASHGHSVLAMDVDTMPGLSFSLGLGATDEGRLPEELAERREKEGWVMREAIPALQLVDRYAVRGPDGILYLQLGKLPGRVRPGSTTAFRYVMDNLEPSQWTVIADLAGGTRQPFFGWGSFASHLALVAEPNTGAMLSARRLSKVTDAAPKAELGLIINKVRDGANVATPLPVWANVPYDDAVAAAERGGEALFDVAPHSAAVKAIADFVQRTLESK